MFTTLCVLLSHVCALHIERESTFSFQAQWDDNNGGLTRHFSLVESDDHVTFNVMYIKPIIADNSTSLFGR